MAEYNKVMTQIKPDLPKVIDTEQIYVYVPKATYDQAGIMKPDRTQFVIAGDYTLSIKHFEITDDHVAVDVKMGYKNDTALADLADKDFVSKSNLTGYSVAKIANKEPLDKAYIEGSNGSGTKLVAVSETGDDGDTIVRRDERGQIHSRIDVFPKDDVLVTVGYAEDRYVKTTGEPNMVYTTNNSGDNSKAQFSNNAIPDTMVYRAYDGSVRGEVVTPIDTTLLNHRYVKSHYIPVGSDGKIPNSYLPADIGADEIVSGYYFDGAFYSDEEHTTVIAGDPDKLYVDIATNKTYRWDAAAGYVQVGSSLALGTSHDTAYYGDFGDAAYAHSLSKGNPHNTRIADVPNLEATLNSKVSVFGSATDFNRVAAFLADQSSPRMCTLYNYGIWNWGKIFRKSTGSTEWTEIQNWEFIAGGVTCLRSAYEPQIKITATRIPRINGVPMTSTTITLPMGMAVNIEFDTTSTVSSTDYFLNFVAANERFVAYFWPHSNGQGGKTIGDNSFKIAMYDSAGRLKTVGPSTDDDALNLGFWKDNCNPFNYTTISTLSAVEHGFNVEYQIDGKSAEIEIPLEGTNDIVVDIDETNKMINIHLDAAVSAKLAKMLTLPAEAPAKNSIVGVGTNNAQMIMTEQEARDAISVFKTVSLTQTEYNNLAVKDNKTLYLITG